MAETVKCYIVEAKSVANKRGAWVVQQSFSGFNEALDYAVEYSKRYIFMKIRIVDEARNNKIMVSINKE